MWGTTAAQRRQNRTFGMDLPYRQARWLIAAWLTLSTILNLIDRQTLSILAPFLREQLHITAYGYSNIVTAFLVSYTVMYSVGGRFVDRVGERLGMTACIVWWSVCTMLTALAQGVMSLGVIRFLLGIGEPGNYPAALKACTRWFPKAERGIPIAMFSSGSSVGNMLAMPLIAGITLHFGWRAAFIIPGALGLLWTVGWLWMYRLPEQYASISREDLAALQDDTPSSAAGARAALPVQPLPTPDRRAGELPDGTAPSRPPRRTSVAALSEAAQAPAALRPAPERWIDLLKNRNVLALVLSRFVSDPVWYFYLFYMPDYLKVERGFSLKDMAFFGWIPFVAGTVGGMSAGAISDWLIRRGSAPAVARTRVLYISAAAAPLGILTSRAHSAAGAIALMAVVAFVVYCWFINTAALIPDLFSDKVVGSVLGLMGTAGSAAGALFAQLVGYLLAHYSYAPAFALAGSMHALGGIILWSLVRIPKQEGLRCA